MADSKDDLPPLCPMDQAEFVTLGITFYPNVRSEEKARKVMDRVQAVLSRPIQIDSIARHEAEKPTYRVDTGVELRCVGAYQTLAAILEFLRPLSTAWFVHLPEPEMLTMRYWHLWGRVDATDIVGLGTVIFEAHERAYEKKYPDGCIPHEDTHLFRRK